ncbi:MAG: hypothetical protein BECKG1743D_GA0114223_101434 [Candidatus Kentron sp. G]|nr:MAG: hypothetical protein BECKG1743F_GA0114225_101135 [Candidatus Kentron sp. G]VFM97756.1 MAG: hypothetical protein BECKG1743E_GA0114224_101493 [Candidatus Kentron sp. G]VFM99745.1 MAG: hypothetical protein BECKG1743D_GA0114223_101434 [Candidatus Kentron sp. G]
MWQDPIVQETRRWREEYAAQFKDDSEAMFQDILRRQSTHKERLVSFRPRKPRQWRGAGEEK